MQSHANTLNGYQIIWVDRDGKVLNNPAPRQIHGHDVNPYYNVNDARNISITTDNPLQAFINREDGSYEAIAHKKLEWPKHMPKGHDYRYSQAYLEDMKPCRITTASSFSNRPAPSLLPLPIRQQSFNGVSSSNHPIWGSPMKTPVQAASHMSGGPSRPVSNHSTPSSWLLLSRPDSRWA
jgi:hypothetical protein